MSGTDPKSTNTGTLPDKAEQSPHDVSDGSQADDTSNAQDQSSGIPAAGTSSKNKKKKNKGKGKAGKLKKELDPTKNAELYNTIKEQHEQTAGKDEAAKFTPEAIAEIMRATQLQEYLQGGAGLMGKNKKDMASYKFWSTQPVVSLDTDPNSLNEGVLEEDKSASEIRQTPFLLPKDFEWVDMDLDQPDQLKEVYNLLTHNYVEDTDAAFRFDYSADFIEWALKPPGFRKQWHVGVRVSSTRTLVAFIGGTPISLRARDLTKEKAVEINFLCVHKKLRSKRLTPVLIKEITRRSNLSGIFQAVYTVGILLPTPVSKSQYFHRSLNPRKLVATGFASVPRGQTLAHMIKKDAVPSETKIKGLREVSPNDIPGLLILLKKYVSRFELVCGWTEEEARHHFLKGQGKVTWTYVVEDPERPGIITDFFSFYSLPSTALKTENLTTVNAAYLSYYASNRCPACSDITSAQEGSATDSPALLKPALVRWDQETAEQRNILQERLVELMTDALVLAKKLDFDVFNALTLMDNSLFLKELKFGAGDGYLHWYLYNWAMKPIEGGAGIDPAWDSDDNANSTQKPVGSGIGMVML